MTARRLQESLLYCYPGTLAAGSYDITFYGPSLNLDDFPNGPQAKQNEYSLYQFGWTGRTPLRTDMPLGFDVIGTPVAAPEPGSMLLFGTGLASLAAAVRRRQRMMDHPRP